LQSNAILLQENSRTKDEIKQLKENIKMKKVKKMITALATSILVLGCNKYRKNYNLQKGHH